MLEGWAKVLNNVIPCHQGRIQDFPLGGSANIDGGALTPMQAVFIKNERIGSYWWGGGWGERVRAPPTPPGSANVAILKERLLQLP